MKANHPVRSPRQQRIARVGSVVSYVGSAAAIVLLAYGYAREGRTLYLVAGGLAAVNLLVGLVAWARPRS